jgi:hypothetical protein
MAMAANGILQWGAEGAVTAQTSPVQVAFPPPALSSPHDVAAALFAELGLSRFLAPATTPGERLMRDIALFAARRTPGDTAATGAKPGAAPRATSGLFANAPRPAAQANTTSVASAPAATPVHVADHVSLERGAAVADAIARPDATVKPDADAGSGADDAATGNGAGWLGLDMWQPREWSADDLAMLMFRDRAAAADALTLRAEQAAAEVAESLDAFIDPNAFDDDASEEAAIQEPAIQEPAIQEFAFADRAAA